MEIVESIVKLNWGAYYALTFAANNDRLEPLREFMVGVDDAVRSYVGQGFLLLIVLGLLMLKGKNGSATVVFVVSGLGVALVEGLRRALPTPGRPHSPVSGLDDWDLAHSFPSGSVLLAFLAFSNVAMAVGEYLPARGQRVALSLLAVILALFVTFTQLFLGRHFLLDVLAGMAGGIGLALLCRGIRQADGPAPIADSR